MAAITRTVAICSRHFKNAKLPDVRDQRIQKRRDRAQRAPFLAMLKMEIRAESGKINETRRTAVRSGPETKASKDCGLVGSNPAKLMMPYVKLELLGTRVGNPERLVKCWSVNFFARGNVWRVKCIFSCCEQKFSLIKTNTNSINSILAFRVPMIDARKDKRRRQADNPGECEDERGGLQTPPGRGQRPMAGGRPQQFRHPAGTGSHCRQGYTRQISQSQSRSKEKALTCAFGKACYEPSLGDGYDSDRERNVLWPISTPRGGPPSEGRTCQLSTGPSGSRSHTERDAGRSGRRLGRTGPAPAHADGAEH